MTARTFGPRLSLWGERPRQSLSCTRHLLPQAGSAPGRPRLAQHRPQTVPYGVVVRIDQGYLGWGVFFVAAGAIALAIGAGVVVDQRWWSFWPLLLVGAGIGLVL